MASTAAAASPQLLGSFRDWTLSSFDGENGKVCYITSEPTKEEGNYTRRGAPVVYVTKLPMNSPNEQVSVRSGYNYLDEGAIEVKVDGRAYEFFTQGESAWLRSPSDDEAMIGAMKRGSRMSVRGTSTKRTYSLDTYSLLGFTAAYDAMRDACN